jgi:hypothetical protein
MSVGTLEELLIDELKDLYSAGKANRPFFQSLQQNRQS